MSRSYRMYLEDMLAAIKKKEKFSRDHSLDEIIIDEMRLDAIIRNFEIIGVAAKNIPDDIKKKFPRIEWRKISDFRNLLAHEYFGINYKIMWDIIINKIPPLHRQIAAVLEKENQ